MQGARNEYTLGLFSSLAALRSPRDDGPRAYVLLLNKKRRDYEEEEEGEGKEGERNGDEERRWARYGRGRGSGEEKG